MNQDEIVAKFKRITAARMEKPESELNPEAHFTDDLGADSC